MEQGYKAVLSLSKNPAKFQQKIKNKEFLMGKYFNIKEENRKKTKKRKCFCASKTQKLMAVQDKLSDRTESQKDFNYFLPLHRLWLSYMSQLIGQQKNQESRSLKVLRSDFHGSLLTVAYSKVNTCVGIKGIVIKETLKTFVLITENDKLVCLIKSPHTFMLTIDDNNFIVHGASLIYRPSDRSKHKFKFKKADKMNLDFLGEFVEEE